MERVQGTCVAIDGTGLLLRGPSGAGKSDLALRLIEAGAALVSDDYTEMTVVNGALMASAPASLAGLLEVRGLGILRLAAVRSAPVAAAVDLVAAEQVERMPPRQEALIAGIRLPVFRIAPFEASAVGKVKLAAQIATGRLTLLQ